MTFVLTYVVVCVFAPLQGYVSGAIPVFARQRHTWAGMCLQQSAVYDVVGIGYALGYAARHLAVVHRICYSFGIIFAFLPSIASDVVYEYHFGKFTVYLVIDAVSYCTARFAYDYVGRPHTAVVDE